MSYHGSGWRDIPEMKRQFPWGIVVLVVMLVCVAGMCKAGGVW